MDETWSFFSFQLTKSFLNWFFKRKMDTSWFSHALCLLHEAQDTAAAHPHAPCVVFSPFHSARGSPSTLGPSARALGSESRKSHPLDPPPTSSPQGPRKAALTPGLIAAALCVTATRAPSAMPPLSCSLCLWPLCSFSHQSRQKLSDTK